MVPLNSKDAENTQNYWNFAKKMNFKMRFLAGNRQTSADMWPEGPVSPKSFPKFFPSQTGKNWWFYSKNRPPPENGDLLGGSDFLNKMINFCPFVIKKILGRIWDWPDLPATYLPATYRPKFVCFRPKIAFWNSFFLQNFSILGYFRHLCCSKVPRGTQKWQKSKILFFSNFLNPKDLLSCFWSHLWWF